MKKLACFIVSQSASRDTNGNGGSHSVFGQLALIRGLLFIGWRSLILEELRFIRWRSTQVGVQPIFGRSLWIEELPVKKWGNEGGL